MNKITEEQKEILIGHCNYYKIKPEIIAWYEDLNDFYMDWKEHVGYTKEKANERLNSETGEFCQFPNGEIVRLSI